MKIIQSHPQTGSRSQKKIMRRMKMITAKALGILWALCILAFIVWAKA
jgi:hypothetical protein